jgi:hypothetical protein
MNTNRTTWQRSVFMAVWCSLVITLALAQAKPNYRVSSHSTQKDPTAPSSHPDIDKLIRALSGSWSLTLNFAPNEKMPQGGSGTGEETWRAGPGGLSVIEEYHSTGDEGEVSGLGIFWPAKQSSAMQVMWCDSMMQNGCGVMSGGARWEGNQIVIENKSKVGGENVAFREVFSDIKENSFTQTVYQGESKDTLKLFATITATRKIVPQGAIGVGSKP